MVPAMHRDSRTPQALVFGGRKPALPACLRRAAEYAVNERVNAATALISTAGEFNNSCWLLWEKFTGLDLGRGWKVDCLGLLLLAEVLETA